VTRDALRKRLANEEYARRFPRRSRDARKKARSARIAVREDRWIQRYDAIERAIGNAGITELPESKTSKIGSDVRRRRRGRSGRSTASAVGRPNNQRGRARSGITGRAPSS
jgi:hypothetical protein